MAADILHSFPAGEPLLVVCLLKSALGFFNALMESQRLLNHETVGNSSRIRILFSEFMRVRSYVNDRSSGNIEVSGISDSHLISAVQVCAPYFDHPANVIYLLVDTIIVVCSCQQKTII